MSRKSREKPFAFRGKYLLLTVIALYVVLFAFDGGAAVAALAKSGAVVEKILPILAGVILFTAILNYFLRPEQVARHLGKESGARAWGWALAAGVASHGPMYVWYPMLEDLRAHGMRDGLIVTLFAARVIKLPPLPLMVDYFGLTYTLVLSFYILTGAFLQGWLFEMMDRK
jgi:uncharacterized membrane protein YraQ (UPF0718 family)